MIKDQSLFSIQLTWYAFLVRLKCLRDLAHLGVRLESFLYLDYQNQISQYSETQARNNAIITLPVVVHIIHTGQAVGQSANLSESRIISQINALNRDYRRQNGDANNTPNSFASVAVDTLVAVTVD